MTKERYDENLAKKASLVLRTLREKGVGYNPTEGTPEFDPFYNYQLGADLAGITPEQAMISRVGEKLTRLGNILKTPEKAGKESISETCGDIVGISLMLWELCESYDEEIEVTPESELPLVAPEVVEKSPIFQRLFGK